MQVSLYSYMPYPTEVNPNHIDLVPIGRKGRWFAELSANVVTLEGADGERVLTIHRDDVARYIRFAWDLRHGRTVSFVLMEGMTPYTFRIDAANLEKLLDWVPQRSASDVRHEVRLHAIALGLFGIFFLLRPAEFGLVWAAALLGLGVAGLVWSDRTIYFFNGAFMFLFGLAQIVPRSLFIPMEGQAQEASQVLPAIAATVFLCWGVQQFSMLGLNAQIRAARTSTAPPEQAHRRSPLVRRIGRIALAVSVPLSIYSVALIAVRWGEVNATGDATLLSLAAHSPDIAIFVALAVFTLAAGAVLLCRKRPAYLDAKVVAQVMIVGFVFLVWAFFSTFNSSDPMSIFNPMLSESGMDVVKLYVWLSLLPAVMAFNRWFAKAMDRELEESSV